MRKQNNVTKGQMIWPMKSLCEEFSVQVLFNNKQSLISLALYSVLILKNNIIHSKTKLQGKLTYTSVKKGKLPQYDMLQHRWDQCSYTHVG